MTPEDRLAERGLALPELRRPAGNYRGWMRAADLLYLSGQGADGHFGRLGADLTVIEGYAVAQVVQVRGFVTSTSDFTDQPGVIDGASDLFAAVFGDRGPHARTAIGVAALPRGFAVEVDAVLLVR